MDEKKKTPDEEEQKAPAAPEEKSEPPKADEKPPEEKPEQEPAPAEEPPKEEPEPDAPEEEPAPEVSSEDPKDKEILQLKTQIAAMKLGIQADCVEDAVAVAEMLVSILQKDCGIHGGAWQPGKGYFRRQAECNGSLPVKTGTLESCLIT